MPVIRKTGGMRDAFEKAAAACEKQVYAVCLYRMGNRDDALDCAQETMLRAYRGFTSFRGDASVSTWFTSIAMNVCTDALRKRQNVLSLDELRQDTGFDPPDAAPGSYARLEQKERMMVLRDCLQKLPEEARRLIILRDMRGMPYEEMAQMLSLPLGTVKSRMSRAREKLSAMLNENAELYSSRSV